MSSLFSSLPYFNDFRPGSMGAFERTRAKGQIVDANTIAIIKDECPEWRDHPEFSQYVKDFENGKIRPRGRPKGPRWHLPTVAAQLEYPFYRRLLRLRTWQGRRVSMLAQHYPGIDPCLPDHLVAAEIVQTKFDLPYGAERFLVKMSEERCRP